MKAVSILVNEETITKWKTREYMENKAIAHIKEYYHFFEVT